MRVPKNVEAIFLAAAVLATSAAYATADVPGQRAAASAATGGEANLAKDGCRLGTIAVSTAGNSRQ
jgi:hypothetical protein